MDTHGGGLPSVPWEAGGGACRSEAGASLPPRKRLLAGLKQNGWLSSPSCSSPSAAASPSCSAWASTGLSGAGLMTEVKLEVDLEGAKMVVDTGKVDGGEQGVCQPVNGPLISKGTNASERDDAEQPKCDSEANRSSCPCAPNSLVSPEKKRRFIRRLSKDSHNSQRESKIRDISEEEPFSGSHSTVATGSKRKPVSPHEKAAAAKLTAAMAAKTAAEAKATATAKAAAAAKAAAVAKAALDAAAIAARDEALNVCTNSPRGSPTALMIQRDKKKNKGDLKGQRDSLCFAQMPPPVDDEELARQLHRVINSSPRISRSQTTISRKEAGKFVEITPVVDLVKPSARGCISSSQRSSQGKPIRGKQGSKRLQSVCMEPEKEVPSAVILNITAPLDIAMPVQISGSLENEDAVDGNAHIDTSPLQLQNIHSLNRDAVELSNQPISTGSRMTNMEEDCSMVHDDKDLNTMNPILLSSNDPGDLNSHMLVNCSFNVGLGQAGSSSSCEVVERENVQQDLTSGTKKEVCLKKGVDEERLTVLAQAIPSESPAYKALDKIHQRVAQDSKKEHRLACGELSTTDEQYLGISIAMEENTEYCKQLACENRELSMSPGLPESKWERGGNVSIGSDINEEKMNRVASETRNCVKAEDNTYNSPMSPMKRKCLGGRSKAFLKSPSQATHGHAEGEPTWHQGILKGLSPGTQSYGGNMSRNPFRSAPPVPLRTPAFASGTTGHHI